MASAPIGKIGAKNAAIGDPRQSRLYADERVALGPAKAWRLLVKSWPFIWEHRQLVYLKCLLAFTSLTFFLITPWPIKIVIDNVIDQQPLTGLPARILRPLGGGDRMVLLGILVTFLALALILVGMVGDKVDQVTTGVDSGGLDQAGFTQNAANDGWSLWNGFFGYYEARVTLDLTQRINQGVRTAIYNRFLRSPLKIYSDQKLGDAVFRVMHDSAAVGAVLYTGVLAPSMSLVMFVLALVILSAQFSDVPMIPIAAALMLPVTGIGETLFGRFLRTQSQDMRERGSDVMAAFEERIAQVQLIKAFGTEEREARTVDAASWASFLATLKMLGIVLAMVLVIAPAAGAIVVGLLYWLMKQTIEGRLTLGDVVLLLSYTSMLAQPAATIGGTWASLQAPIAGLRRIHSVLDAPIEAEPRVVQQKLAPITQLKFRDVAVGYLANAPVVSGVSFELHRGEMIALAGPSGVGKTALMLAIPRFIETQEGAILLDGQSILDLAPAAIRARVGFVFQQEALFAESIAANIRYSRPGATDREVQEAASMAGAAEFIAHLPGQYETVLGRRGTRLSIGQKQRVAIARALLHRPDLLILDEPAAPLDADGEHALVTTLRELARTRIVVIAAHGINTLMACDRVLLIGAGRLCATGSHNELIARSAEYRSYLAASQSEIRP